MKSRIFEGIKVVDITLAYAGPWCAMNFADMGAEVIKVEPIGGEQTRLWGPFKNDYSGYFAYFNRNKKGIALNMKDPEGKEALMKLIATADVLIENFRVGTLNRLGFSYEEVKKINPNIIYASISGFGVEGPMADHPTYDIVAQAESGMMSLNGTPATGPMKIGPSVADSYTGTFCALAIASALYNREKTGEGMRIDVAMTDVMASVLESFPMNWFLNGENPTNQGNMDGAADVWDAYTCKDGGFVIACGTDKHRDLLAQAMGMPDLFKDPRFVTLEDRQKNYWGPGELKEIINNWAADKTQVEVEEAIYGAGVPFGKIQTVKQYFTSEQTKVRNMVWTVDDPGFGEKIQMPGCPMKFHGLPDEPTKAAPLNGEDNVAVLKSVGYTDEQIASLRERGIFN